MTGRPRALLFDLGNVCLPFDHGRMVGQLAALFEVPDECVRAALLDSEALLKIEQGLVSDDELHANLCTQFGRQVDRRTLFDAASDIFTPNPEMETLLAELAAGELPLILVSNTSRPHIEFVRREYDILANFDRLVLSYEVKASKPDPAFYRHAVKVAGAEVAGAEVASAQVAGVSPGDCFFTDDVPVNVAGAADFGMDAVLFESAAQLRRELATRGVLTD